MMRIQQILDDNTRLKKENEELLAKFSIYHLALAKINAIRESIVAHQTVNFSEHVYPLVAALNEAGVKGMGYPEAMKYYGSATDRAVKAENALKRLRASIKKSRQPKRKMKKKTN